MGWDEMEWGELIQVCILYDLGYVDMMELLLFSSVLLMLILDIDIDIDIDDSKSSKRLWDGIHTCDGRQPMK